MISRDRVRPHFPKCAERLLVSPPYRCCTGPLTTRWSPKSRRAKPLRPTRLRFVRHRPFSSSSSSLLSQLLFLHAPPPPCPDHRLLLALIHFVCFPVAPYLMRCKSSVRRVHLPWFIHASSLSRLEWVLMFHASHPHPHLHRPTPQLTYTQTFPHSFEGASRRFYRHAGVFASHMRVFKPPSYV